MAKSRESGRHVPENDILSYLVFSEKLIVYYFADNCVEWLIVILFVDCFAKWLIVYLQIAL